MNPFLPFLRLGPFLPFPFLRLGVHLPISLLLPLKCVHFPRKKLCLFSSISGVFFFFIRVSRYHEGLMTSRALASHELVLLMGLVDCLLGNRIGFPAREQPAGMLQSPRVLLARPKLGPPGPSYPPGKKALT